MKHVFGKLFDRRDWKQWIVAAERIIMHPDYNENGSRILNNSVFDFILWFNEKLEGINFNLINIFNQIKMKSMCSKARRHFGVKGQSWYKHTKTKVKFDEI